MIIHCYQKRDCNIQCIRLLILGTPSLLINTLFDLIRYYPSEIMIFNSTLYYPINNKIRNLNTKK